MKIASTLGVDSIQFVVLKIGATVSLPQEICLESATRSARIWACLKKDT